MDYLEALNHKQTEAVLHTEGPLLIVAGAGTGKTKTLTYRMFHLIQQGISGEHILAITFTNKAAAEMRERIHALLPAYHVALPFVSTFHGLGVHILKHAAPLLGISRFFTILDSDDSLSLIKEAMEAEGMNPKEIDPKKIRGLISRAKGEAKNPDSFHPDTLHPLHEIMLRVWRRYETMLAKRQSFDFDDLLIKSYEALKKFEVLRKYFQERWRYVHIDEYQDTNTIQYEIARLLSEPQGNICVVGDSDQNIYSWRGANIKNILNFEKDFPGAHSVILEQNYRSTDIIVEAAQEIIRKNTERIPKILKAYKQGGHKIKLYQALNETDEARYVTRVISGLLESGTSPQSIAVLFRTNFQSRIVEEACLYESIPYQMVGVKFFARKEIKDALSYMRAALNPESLSDIARIINIPKRGIGKVTLAKIMSGEANTLPVKVRKVYTDFQKILTDIRTYTETHTPSEALRYVISHSGLESMYQAGGSDEHERLQNLYELVTYATRYDDMPHDEAFEKMMEHIALMSDQDTLIEQEEGGSTQAVRLMTIHASKGLEFDHVFIVGLEEGLFPSNRDKENREQEEERRLMYVAITRAREHLYLSYAQTRRIFGEFHYQSPSPFVLEIPDHLLEDTEGGGSDTHPFGTVYLDW
jgi:DNA helicase II / ATP-dependent DNA helicase PcrA